MKFTTRMAVRSMAREERQREKALRRRDKSERKKSHMTEDERIGILVKLIAEDDERRGIERSPHPNSQRLVLAQEIVQALDART